MQAGAVLEELRNLIPLRDFCRQNPWPRLPQWNNWIYSDHPIAVKCVKRVGGRYYVALDLFREYIKNATYLPEEDSLPQNPTYRT